MASRGGRDFHGQALAGFERTLRGMKGQEKDKVLTLAEQIAKAEKDKEEAFAAKTDQKNKERNEEEEVRFSNYREPNKIVPKNEREPKEKKERKPRVSTPEFMDETKDVVLIEVLYGIEGSKIDITDKVQPGQKVNNKAAGQDPAPGKRKKVFVKATVDGEEVEKTFAEGKYLIF